MNCLKKKKEKFKDSETEIISSKDLEKLYF